MSVQEKQSKSGGKAPHSKDRECSHVARASAAALVAQARLYRLCRGAGANLLARLRTEQLPLLLRRRPVFYPGRGVARESAARLGAARRHLRAADALGSRFLRGVVRVVV